MLLLGSSPKSRNIEQHDVFFGIGTTIKELIPEIIDFWPEAKEKLHLDAWREITNVNGFQVSIIPQAKMTTPFKLFFLNLGGYKKDEFEEFHYKMIVAATDKGDAVGQAKSTAFFKHTGIKGATSHIDDKYGIDVDDLFEIKDILPPSIKDQYSILVSPAEQPISEDEIHLGYFKLDSF